MNAAHTSDLIRALVDVVGEAHVRADGDLSAFERDWRKRFQGKAAAVVLPRDTAQVAAVVRVCQQHGACIVPQGGNTGLVGASIPDGSGRQVLLSLRRMTAIRQIDAANATLTAEAGCVLQQVQEAAREAGRLFPLSLAAEGSCTIGGNLSTNAGGTQVLRYGNARELCLGLEVVTAQGEIWNGLSGLRKDNTGYDLRDLFIGSEGTLGIITAATLKLFPLPVAQRTAWVTMNTLEEAVRLLDLCRSALGAGLTGFEVIGQYAMQLVARHYPDLKQPVEPPAPWSVLMEISDNESAEHAQERLETVLGQALEDGFVLDAVIAASIDQSRRLWHLRETLPLAQADQGANIKHDISVPISQIPAFVKHTDAALRAAFPGVELVNFGHLGDGNLHYNVQPPAGVDALAFVESMEHAVNRVVFDAVEAAGGSISAEHGIGHIKRDALAERKSPVALRMMHAIKQALDPQGLMNPGRVLRAAASKDS